MELNEAHIINDYSVATILEVCARIERSASDEQLIYRESELDEVWRLLDADISSSQVLIKNEPALQFKIPQLKALREVTVKAHDLIGVEGDTATAAKVLRSYLLELPHPL